MSLITTPATPTRPALKNCWTCKFNDAENLCDAPYPDAGHDIISDWLEGQGVGGHNLMPSKDADGCPGYAPRAE